MKVYVSHASCFDFRAKLYEPIKREFASSHTIILPHEAESDFNSKATIQTSDLVIAEVSYPSTGQGIELGWADASGVPILCIYWAGSQVSSALKFVTDSFIAYDTAEDMVDKLRQWLSTSQTR